MDSTPSRPDPIAGSLPRRFGRYELLEELGRGGAGVIFKARQPGLDRLCAVKMLHEHSGTQAVRTELLMSEARAAATLDHPNIVGIYEVGEAEGHHFYSMEFVEGENLSAFVRSRMVSAQKAAHYAHKIAAAIEYAHSRGVTHCDLKPANVLIDQRGEPQITDFGLARPIGANAKASSDPTSGAGSPNFMAPEQASDRFGSIGPRTDVFGLGAILYYLLTDRPPFRGETLNDTIRAVTQLDPVRPRALRPGVPIDLETICLKCLEKRPGRRYQSMQEVTEELGRFLRDEPVHARRITQIERGWRFARRHPAISGFATATFALLLVIAVGSPIAAYRIDQARQSAEIQQRRAEANELRVRRQLYAAHLQEAAQAVESSDSLRARDLLQGLSPSLPTSQPRSGESTDLRGWEWRYLAAQSRGDDEEGLPRGTFPLVDLALVGDGPELVALRSDGTLMSQRMTNRIAGTGRELGESGPTNQPSRLCVSLDQRRLAIARVDLVTTQSVVRVVDRIGWREESRFTVEGGILNLAFDRNSGGLILAVSRYDGRFVNTSLFRSRLDGSGLQKLSELPKSIRLSLPTFNADGTRVAIARDDASLEVRDVAGVEPPRALAGHGFEPGWVQLITGFEFFPDGRRMVSAGVDKTARIWDLKTGQELAVLRGHSDVVQGLAVSEDNRWVATSSRDRTVRIWDAATGAPAGTLRSRDSVPIGLIFTRDGSSLVSILSNGDCRFWSVRTAIERTLPAAALDKGILWSEQLPDGLHWWSSTPEQKWELHRLGTAGPIAQITDTNHANLRSRTFHPGTQRLAYVATDGTVTIQSLPGGGLRRLNSGVSNSIATARFSTDGRLLAVGLGSSMHRLGSGTNQIQVWDVDSGRVIQSFVGAAEIHVFSPDNRWLASSDSHGKVQLNDLTRGGTRLLGSHRTQVPGLAFSPDSSELASACTDGTIKIWNVHSGSELATLETQTSGVLCVAYSPAGDRLISGSLDGVLQVWDARARLRLATFHRHSKGITSLAFRDADTLVSGGLDAIRIWQADPHPHPSGDGATMESAVPTQPGGRRS